MTERPESRRCPSCSSQVPATAAFCDVCGHEFGTTQAMAPVRPDVESQPQVQTQVPPKAVPRKPRTVKTAQRKTEAQARPATTSGARRSALSQLPWGVVGVAGVIFAVVVGAMLFLQQGTAGSPGQSDPSATIAVVIDDPLAQAAGEGIGITATIESANSATFTPEPPTHTPAPSPTPIPPLDYTVKAGDSCGVIAQRNGVPLETFAAFNGLDSVNCFIRVGDVLKIPVPTPTPGPTQTLAPGVTPESTATSGPSATPQPQVTYVVQPADTCGGIAEQLNVTLDLLIAQNNLNADCLIGLNQVLTITFATATPAATVTPFVLQTPTPRVGYPAPVVLAPPDAASISETQQVVTLQWLTVGLLKPNEWYVVQVQPSGAITVPVFETKATSLKLTQDILGDLTEDEVVWWVQVKQLLATDPNTGARIYNDAGPASPPRRFTWRRPESTPTPAPQ